MGRVHATGERHVDAPADRVYARLADFRTHHPRFLPPALSDFCVEEGGVGAKTIHPYANLDAFGWMVHGGGSWSEWEAVTRGSCSASGRKDERFPRRCRPLAEPPRKLSAKRLARARAGLVHGDELTWTRARGGIV